MGSKPKMPAAPVAVPPVSHRSSDVIASERLAMQDEKKKKGIGSTILAGSFKPGANMVGETFGTRTILGSY